MNSKIVSLNKAVKPFLLICSVLLAAPLSAQNYGNNNGSNIHVTVFEHCDFGGAARNVPVGDFPDMRSIQMKNDSISSFRVPEGLELTLFQDDRYGGFSSTFDRDVSCMDRGWNDQVSSLKVNWSGRSGSRGDSRDRGFYPGSDSGFYTKQNVDGNNASRIEFAGLVLEKSGQRQWDLTNPNGSRTAFQEVSKNANSIYLENNSNRQQLRIDMFTNDVTVISNNGERASYALNQALRANENYRGERDGRGNPENFENPVFRTQPVEDIRNKGNVRGECFDYRAYSNGGQAGLRFHAGDKTFKRFTTAAATGRICHRGSVVMELSKTSPSTDVTVEIQGVKYHFSSNESHDTLLNNWYRKNVTLNVRP